MTAPQAVRPRSTAREYFESICAAVILALFVRTFVFQAFKIPTGSMQDNLLIGDHLMVNKMLYHDGGAGVLPSRDVERGDVVVFKFPEEPERDFIKRVVGLPGETLQIGRRQVLVGGDPLPEDYTRFVHGGQPGMREYRVPDGTLFRDGGQPGQQPRQPLLGRPSRREHQGQGALHLLVLRRPA